MPRHLVLAALLLVACGDDGSTSSSGGLGGGGGEPAGAGGGATTTTGSGGDSGEALIAFFNTEGDDIRLEGDVFVSLSQGSSTVVALPIQADCPAGMITCITFRPETLTDAYFLEAEAGDTLIHVFAGDLGSDGDVTTNASLLDEPGLGESVIAYRTYVDYVDYGILLEDGTFRAFTEGSNVVPAGSTFASYDTTFELQERPLGFQFEEGARYAMVVSPSDVSGHYVSCDELAFDGESGGFSSSFGGP